MQNKTIKNEYSDGEVFIRPIEKDDLKISLENRNLNKKWFFYNKEISWEEHLNWFNKYSKDPSDYVFMICKNKTLEQVGQISLYSISDKTHDAEFGRCLVFKGHNGNNYLFKAGNLLKELAKKEFNLKNMHLEVKKDNQKAIHIYSKLGFTTFQENDDNIKMALNLCEANL